MRSFIWLSVIALLASAGTALAKPPPPGGGDCPPDFDVGAALAATCPCDAAASGQAWKNHGQYVSCVVRYRNALRKQGCLDADAKRTIARCAARSTCGKEGAVLCCVYDTSGICSDQDPSNFIAEGTCSNNAQPFCNSNADCALPTGPPRVTRHEGRCAERGGTAVGGGSACSDCPLPSPLPTPLPPPPVVP